MNFFDPRSRLTELVSETTVPSVDVPDIAQEVKVKANSFYSSPELRPFLTFLGGVAKEWIDDLIEDLIDQADESEGIPEKQRCRKYVFTKLSETLNLVRPLTIESFVEETMLAYYETSVLQQVKDRVDDYEDFDDFNNDLAENFPILLCKAFEGNLEALWPEED